MTYPYATPDQGQPQYQQGPPQQGYGPPPQQGYGPPPQQGYAQPQYPQGPPPQQSPQWGPPQQGGYAPQNGYPQQGQQQAPPTIPGTLDAFYSQPSMGGGVPWSFEHIGTEYFGIVRRALTDGDTEQQYTLGQNPVPATFKDGRPKLVLRVPLSVPKSEDNPEGMAQWYCRGTSRDLLGAAMAAVGAPLGPPEVGSGIYVKHTGTKKGAPGMNPSKSYDVRYWRPEQAAAIAAQMGIDVPNPPDLPATLPGTQAPPVPPTTPQAPQPDQRPDVPQQPAPTQPQQGYGPPPQYADPAAAQIGQAAAQGQYGPPQQQPPQQQPPQWGPPQGGAPQQQAPPPPPVTWQQPGTVPQAGYVPQPTQNGQAPQQAAPAANGGLLGALTGR